MNISALIRNTAAKHGLPPELVEAVVKVESNYSPWAMRYESGFFERYVRGKGHRVFGHCTRQTEETARATSFGLMQVMGQVAREHGFTGPYLSELFDPATGLEYGCQHLASHARRFPAPAHGWQSAVAAYNGGAGAVFGPQRFKNPEYVAKVEAALGGKWPARG